MKKESMKIYDELKAMSDRIDNINKPTPEPKDKFGNTKAQKDKMVEDWLTRPSTKPYRAALAKKDREQQKWKYESWNGKTKPDKEPIVEYVDRMMKKYGNWGSEEVKEATPEQMEGLKKRLDNARAFTNPPKK